MDIGECAHCKRIVTPASTCAFAFGHVDASTKTRCIGSMAWRVYEYEHAPIMIWDYQKIKSHMPYDTSSNN